MLGKTNSPMRDVKSSQGAMSQVSDFEPAVIEQAKNIVNESTI